MDFPRQKLPHGDIPFGARRGKTPAPPVCRPPWQVLPYAVKRKDLHVETPYQGRLPRLELVLRMRLTRDNPSQSALLGAGSRVASRAVLFIDAGATTGSYSSTTPNEPAGA